MSRSRPLPPATATVLCVAAFWLREEDFSWRVLIAAMDARNGFATATWKTGADN